MPKSKLRHFAGRAKFRVLDCWPYKFKEIRAAKLREQFRPMAFQLPQILAPRHPEVEIHMLCGKAYLDMGIWASWSILRFLENALLYVHSDGTLEDIAAWRKVIPEMVLVSKTESNERAAKEISSRYPLLYRWRCQDWGDTHVLCGTHVVDMHLFGKSDRLIVMDVDVLCFRRPVQLEASLALDEPVYRWNRDVRSCYSESMEVLNSITGLKLPEALNSGFQLTPRFGREEFEYLEQMIELLQTDGRVDTNHLWSSQMYCAMCAAIRPDSHALPDSYNITLGRTRDNAVIRHYVGVPRVRPRYFTEGIPKILRDL
jgi:hypothetical protein